ncbi:MAG: NADH:flavin oxidoreductase [Pseudomonadota bacterium]
MTEDVIFQPLDWPKLKVKNRIFRSSISGRFDNEDGGVTQTRINWENKFARGGVGAIISSYVPVLMEGRIIAGYATIHDDRLIEDWAKLTEAVHVHDCRYIMQLSHSGRQMDVPGVHNQQRPTLSSTSNKEALNGFLCEAMTPDEIDRTIKAFAQGARRAKEAGVDGVELHASHGYLITQFLSSGINDRCDDYGGSLHNRARFLLDTIRAIRAEVGDDYHLQVKLSGIDHNNVIPWEGKGNTLDESIEVAKWCEVAGADALHASIGSLFPHPLMPPGGFDFESIAATYDAMISSGVDTFRNYLLFRYPLLRPIFRWLWFRMKTRYPVEGVAAEVAHAFKRNVGIPVICTGGFQDAALIRKLVNDRWLDGVTITRALVANNDLPKQWQAGNDIPDRPCTFCNKCLLNAPKNPMGCYELERFGGDWNQMVEELMTIYETKPTLQIPDREAA